MFLGRYRHTIDDKGRLTIPARYRSDLAGGVVVTRGLDGCLWLFTMADWEKIGAGQASIISFAEQSARDFSRYWYSNAVDIIPDKQGRILIPPALREYAGIDGEVVITGAGMWVEIWNPLRWEEVNRRAEANAEANAQIIAEKIRMERSQAR